MTKHTLSSFIRAECANLVSDNQCLGLDVSNKRFMNQDKCLILRKKRCDYFKKCVLPLARLKGCYDGIIREYMKIDKTIDQSEEARFCECGAELRPRQRFCAKCRKIRRLKTHKDYNRGRGFNNDS